MNPVCQKCCHFFLTYEYAKPYGCRALNFKSKQPPSQVVRASSGMACQMFREKQRTPSPASGWIA